MRYSKVFGKTRHNSPVDADCVNAKFLTQAGFIEKIGAGVYAFLPLGFRVLSNIIQIIREEMNSVGGQELLMPALQPIANWEKTGRDVGMNDILYRTGGPGSKDFILGPTHEEIVTPLVNSFVQSYKDLPLSVYQFQSKFRYEPRAKSGLIRGREFGMKDMYSFHTDENDLDKYYEEVAKAYFRVYERAGLKAYKIEASGGAFSDKFSHEYSVESSAGEDTIIICDECGFAQNLEVATGKVVENESEDSELELKKVPAEHGPGIQENAKFHAVPESQILKTVVYSIEEIGLVGVVIRGDLKVNEVKLEKYFKKRLRPAEAVNLVSLGLVPGFISPVNIDEKIGLKFIADHSVKNVKNWVTGANEANMDYVNANIGRDFIISDFTDLVEVRAGFACPNCECSLKEIKAIEAGNIFKLGSKFSEAFNLKFTDKDGIEKPVVMGCYGIGTSRLVGTIVEASHDEKGIIWPKSVAPYLVHLVRLGEDESVLQSTENLYNDLIKSGIEVLYDDRPETAGVKLNDADLIGIPLRLIISKRSLENNSVEWKFRNETEALKVPLTEVLKKVLEYKES